MSNPSWSYLWILHAIRPRIPCVLSIGSSLHQTLDTHAHNNDDHYVVAKPLVDGKIGVMAWCRLISDWHVMGILHCPLSWLMVFSGISMCDRMLIFLYCMLSAIFHVGSKRHFIWRRGMLRYRVKAVRQSGGSRWFVLGFDVFHDCY